MQSKTASTWDTLVYWTGVCNRSQMKCLQHPGWMHWSTEQKGSFFSSSTSMQKHQTYLPFSVTISSFFSFDLKWTFFRSSDTSLSINYLHNSHYQHQLFKKLKNKNNESYLTISCGFVCLFLKQVAFYFSFSSEPSWDKWVIFSDLYHIDTSNNWDCALTQLLEFFMLKKIRKNWDFQ